MASTRDHTILWGQSTQIEYLISLKMVPTKALLFNGRDGEVRTSALPSSSKVPSGISKTSKMDSFWQLKDPKMEPRYSCLLNQDSKTSNLELMKRMVQKNTWSILIAERHLMFWNGKRTTELVSANTLFQEVKISYGTSVIPRILPLPHLTMTDPVILCIQDFLSYFFEQLIKFQ